jgi:hypothetical protein
MAHSQAGFVIFGLVVEENHPLFEEQNLLTHGLWQEVPFEVGDGPFQSVNGGKDSQCDQHLQQELSLGYLFSHF